MTPRVECCTTRLEIYILRLKGCHGAKRAKRGLRDTADRECVRGSPAQGRQLGSRRYAQCSRKTGTECYQRGFRRHYSVFAPSMAESLKSRNSRRMWDIDGLINMKQQFTTALSVYQRRGKKLVASPPKLLSREQNRARSWLHGLFYSKNDFKQIIKPKPQHTLD